MRAYMKKQEKEYILTNDKGIIEVQNDELRENKSNEY